MTLRYTEITLETVGQEYEAALVQLETRYHIRNRSSASDDRGISQRAWKARWGIELGRRRDDRLADPGCWRVARRKMSSEGRRYDQRSSSGPCDAPALFGAIW
jgi:hypothetical protein